jgi:excisionase family DNA binding protein
MTPSEVIAALAKLDDAGKWRALQWLMRDLNGTQPSSPGPVHASNGAPALVDADELAQALSLPRSQIMTLARQGKIPSLRVGKYVRFNLAEVELALRNGAEK